MAKAWGGKPVAFDAFPSPFHSLRDGAAHEQISELIGSGLENSLSKPISQGKSEALWHYKIK